MFFLECIESILGSFYFILPATSLSFLLKLVILVVLIRKTFTMDTVARPLFFLFAILVGNMFSDLAWILKLSQLLFLPEISYQIVLFIIRVAWIFLLVQFQSISLFIESLVTDQYSLPFRQKVLDYFLR